MASPGAVIHLFLGSGVPQQRQVLEDQKDDLLHLLQSLLCQVDIEIEKGKSSTALFVAPHQAAGPAFLPEQGCQGCS